MPSRHNKAGSNATLSGDSDVSVYGKCATSRNCGENLDGCDA